MAPTRPLILLHHPRPRRAFTLVEIIIVVFIMAIVAGIGVDAIASYDASSRPERAARECLQAFRYARQLAITSGKNTKVSFNTSTNTFSVYRKSNGTTWDATPVAQPAGQGGVYTVTMSRSPELKGVTISLNPAGTVDFTFNSLGSIDNATVVTFTYGTRTKTLTVAQVGDPTLN